MKTIPLTKGAVALVDDADYSRLVLLGRWCLNNHGYAVHYTYRGDRRKVLHMHRLIMNAPPHLQVDHINRDRLDNRRSNLRFATRSQNQGNKGRQVNNTSGYKGVIFNQDKWEARIRKHGKRIYLGRYETALEAALAYDAASQLLFANFAGRNLPGVETPDHVQVEVLRRVLGADMGKPLLQVPDHIPPSEE